MIDLRPSPNGRARHRAARLLVALPMVATLAVATPVGSAAGPRTQAPDASSALEQARALLPAHLASIGATSPALERAEGEILALEATIATNRTIRDEANVALVWLAGERDQHRATIVEQRDRRLAAGMRAEQLRRELADLAVAAYVGGGRTEDALPLDASRASDSGRQQVLVDAVDSTLRSRLSQAEAEIADAAGRVESARSELEETVGEIDRTTARRDAAEAELARAEPALPVAQEHYRDAFMVATVVGSDMSVVAYDSYRTAADRFGGCGVSWTVLAGIGRVESRHGTYGGARPQADGATSPRIIGIALDGRPGIATIADTDGGALDGDPVHDRAVGPMQFIPGTWRTAGRDGNGDGRVDPHNLYDAAASAAGYLCRGGSVGSTGSLRQAILSYNRSQAYVDAVLGHGRAYDGLGLP